MKTKIYTLIIAMLACCAALHAQYTTATFNSPWIIVAGDYIYITFDGNGNVLALGEANDVLHPVGTYNVFSGDSIYAVINESGGTGYVLGAITNDSTVNFLFDSVQPGQMIKVTNTGALADTLTGYIFDSVNLQPRNVQFAINSSGAITWATGITGVTGNIFESNGIVAGYITSTDTGCEWQNVQFEGAYSNDSVLGQAKLNKNSNGCSAQGSFYLKRSSTVTTGIANIQAGNTATVYPNPFTGNIAITGLQPGIIYNLTTTDISGRTIAQSTLTGTGASQPLNIPAQAKGMYILHISNAQNTQNIKLVKD